MRAALTLLDHLAGLPRSAVILTLPRSGYPTPWDSAAAASRAPAPLLRPKNLLHLPAPGELIDELVEVPHLLREGGLDVFDPVAADDALDQVCVGVEGRLGEELLEGRSRVDVLLDLFVREPGEPTDDLVQFFLFPALLLDFGHVVRVDR
jgi:hypothetical protein